MHIFIWYVKSTATAIPNSLIYFWAPASPRVSQKNGPVTCFEFLHQLIEYKVSFLTCVYLHHKGLLLNISMRLST